MKENTEKNDDDKRNPGKKLRKPQGLLTDFSFEQPAVVNTVFYDDKQA
jgi:hypothetical protein